MATLTIEKRVIMFALEDLDGEDELVLKIALRDYIATKFPGFRIELKKRAELLLKMIEEM